MSPPVSWIPGSAECVFQGIRGQVFQWDQQMYDGSMARFERIRGIDGGFVIASTSDGKIIITEQEQPARDSFLSLPGGMIERDEDSLEGTKRELLEETGYKSDDWELYFVSSGTNIIVIYTYFYIARNVYQVGSMNPDVGEKIRLRFIGFDEFLELSEDESFVNWPIIRELFKARIHQNHRDILYKKIFGKK